MTEPEARSIAKMVAHAQPFAWDSGKVATWVLVLASPNQADVQFADAQRATVELLAEVERPGDLSPALILHRARSYAKARAPSTVQQMDARWRITDQRKRRWVCTRDDRAALGRLFEAFAKRGMQKQADELFATLQRKDGLEWGLDDDDPAEESCPF